MLMDGIWIHPKRAKAEILFNSLPIELPPA